MFRSREKVFYDSATGEADAAGGEPRPPRTADRPPAYSTRMKVAAVLAPAVIAGLLGTLLAPGDGGGPGAAFAPATASAAQLARWADEPAPPSALPALAPLSQSDGMLEPLTGGGSVARPSAPRRIAIPDAGVSARIESVGDTKQGLELPGPHRAGWWKGGPRPGEVGRAVIVGHLDTKEGPEVFARVPSLKRGAPISVQDRSGAQHLYSVVGVTRVRKARFPTNQVYGPSKRPVLVLITCGGPYDAKRGHYRDNVLVYARAV